MLRRVQTFVDATSLRRRPVARWGVAGAVFAAALGIRMAVDHSLPAGFPYLTFFPAVIVTAFFAGLVPGIVVAVLSGLSAWYFFIPPVGSFGLNGGAALALVFYVFIVAVDLSLIHWMQAALERLAVEKEAAAEHARQRDTLFAELQHRVSNNLAVVSALLTAQARASGSAEVSAALSQGSARIALISKIQRELHDPARQSLDLAPYLEQLGPDLLAASGRTDIAYVARCAPVTVSADLAVPLGLIATELISNAIEHGFGDGRSGRIEVRLNEDARGHAGPGRGFVLTVADDGPGWPEGFSLGRTRDLGMRIVASLAQQIGAAVEIRNENGAVAALRFNPVKPAI